MDSDSVNNLNKKIDELENRLAESEQLIEAIKAGEVDAFAFNSNNQAEVYTLQSGDFAYRVLIEEFGEGALNLSEDGLIVYTNNYFAELINTSYDKVMGTYINDVIADDSKELFERLFHSALHGRSKGEINLFVNDKIIPVYISLSSLKPTLPTVGMIVTDFSEKKKNEEELAAKNAELIASNKELENAKNFIDNVLESTNHGVLSYVAIRENNIIVDLEIKYANDIALEQLKLPLNKVLGKRYLDVLPQAKDQGLFDRIVRVIESQVSETYEMRSPNFYERWFIAHYVPLGDGVTATFVEITDQKKQAYDLEEKNLELERSNKELASFNYIASHDLQEPLRKIQTFANRILDRDFKNLPPTTKDHFQRIVAASTRMKDLIEALLNYSRTNTSDIIFESTDLNILLEEVKGNLRELLDENNASIEFTPLPTLNVVPHQFVQLFSNIISNAIKYRSPEKNPVINISADIVPANQIRNVAGIIEDKYWRIQIEDNGIGFEQHYAEKIFELFQRLHARSEYEGTGIGLAICKKIIQNHKGFIEATGRPGGGAIFKLFLPLTNRQA